MSIFWHEGEYGEGEEWQVVLKTTEARYDELESHLVDTHPWNNPEVTAVPIMAGAKDYLTWVASSTSRRC